MTLFCCVGPVLRCLQRNLLLLPRQPPPKWPCCTHCTHSPTNPMHHIQPPPAPPGPPPQALAKRALMGFDEPPKDAQELAWSRVLDLFGRTLKA